MNTIFASGIIWAGALTGLIIVAAGWLALRGAIWRKPRKVREIY